MIQIVMSSLWHHSQAEANKYPFSHIPVIWDVLGPCFSDGTSTYWGTATHRSGASTAAGSSSLWSVDVISRIRERFTTWTSYLRCRWVAVGGWVWTKLQVWNLKMWGETLCIVIFRSLVDCHFPLMKLFCGVRITIFKNTQVFVSFFGQRILIEFPHFQG